MVSLSLTLFESNIFRVWLTVVLVITLANLAVYCHIFIASARRHRLAQWLRDSAVNSKITDEHVEKFLQLLGIGKESSFKLLFCLQTGTLPSIS